MDGIEQEQVELIILRNAHTLKPIDAQAYLSVLARFEVHPLAKHLGHAPAVDLQKCERP